MRAALVFVLVALQPVQSNILEGQGAANRSTTFEVRATTPAAIAAIRSRLIAQIWGSQGYPARLADAVMSNVNPQILESSIPLANLRQVDRYVVTTNGNTVQPLVLRPIASNGKLVLVGLGHAVSGTLAGVKVTPQLINIALERGVTVLLTPMPLGGTVAHDALGRHGSGTFHPMQYFLDPGIVALNTYLAQNPAPTEILATGISGGGWFTVVLSALDTRVTKSFPIAGSLPLGLRESSNTSDYGDWEQRLHGLTVDRNAPLDYPDLYLMAASDLRTQVQINNTVDPCCFYGTRHLAYAPQLSSLTSNWTFHQESAPGVHGASQQTMTEVLGGAFGKVLTAEPAIDHADVRPGRPRPVDQVIDDGDEGFAATGPGWFHRINEAAAWGGDIHHVSPNCAAGGTGQNVATWTFVNLPYSEAEVALTWTAHENRASNALVTIVDAGDHVLMSVGFNQKKAPVGFTVAGKVFQPVGRVSASGGTVKVRITDDANGCVVADAVVVKAATELPEMPRQDP